MGHMDIADAIVEDFLGKSEIVVWELTAQAPVELMVEAHFLHPKSYTISKSIIMLRHERPA